MSLTPPPPPPPGKLCLWCIFFAFPAMNGPLPAELKFRENTEPGKNPGQEKPWPLVTTLS